MVNPGENVDKISLEDTRQVAKQLRVSHPAAHPTSQAASLAYYSVMSTAEAKLWILSSCHETRQQALGDLNRDVLL